MRTVAKVISVAIAAVALAGIGGAIYFVSFSPDRAKYPVRGIDVSHHQGSIDWTQVAADDVDFAIIKATEGGDFVDEDFAANAAGARQAGLTFGAYHFFTLCRAGDEQAQNFLKVISGLGATLPPVVDLEYGGNCSARPATGSLMAELTAFVEPVEAATNREVIFYVTDDFYHDHGAALPPRTLWVRSIVWHPGHEGWVYWQYHDRGRIKGIEGDVDLNVLQGDKAALAALVK